ncbi:hypothetical protein ACWGIR_23165 [Streptomyces albidoflavus]
MPSHFHPAFIDRYCLCVTWRPERALLLLLAVTSEDCMSVTRAAVRTAEDPAYAASAAVQMYGRVRRRAPVTVVLLSPGSRDHRLWLRALQRHLGPSVDLVSLTADAQLKAGTWGGAVQAAAAGGGVLLRQARETVAHLAREARVHSVGLE